MTKFNKMYINKLGITGDPIYDNDRGNIWTPLTLFLTSNFERVPMDGSLIFSVLNLGPSGQTEISDTRISNNGKYIIQVMKIKNTEKTVLKNTKL